MNASMVRKEHKSAEIRGLFNTASKLIVMRTSVSVSASQGKSSLKALMKIILTTSPQMLSTTVTLTVVK